MPDASVGVYVHVPFCGRVCPYCDFAVVGLKAGAGSGAASTEGSLGESVESRYVDALLRELDGCAAQYAGRRLASLYLGGGTPSLLAPASVERIGRAVRSVFLPRPAAALPRPAAALSRPAAAPRPEPEPEFTLEVNPSTLERSRLTGFREAGVNRVSIGVQSFDDGILKRLGRAHRAEEAVATLEACRAAGFDNLSIDLIFAGPGQTEADVDRDVSRALDFAPEHISTYELTIEPGTPFALAHSRGQLDLPSEDSALVMMKRVEDRLAAAGIARYEISNYARPGFEAVHNRRYWEREPVLGLGMGAFSTLPAEPSAPFGGRRSNPRDLATYLDQIESAQSESGRSGARSGATPRIEVFDAETARGEAVFLALRATRGLDAARFAAEFGDPPREFFAEAIEKLLGHGLIEELATGDLRLTSAGRCVADTVFAEFVG